MLTEEAIKAIDITEEVCLEWNIPFDRSQFEKDISKRLEALEKKRAF